MRRALTLMHICTYMYLAPVHRLTVIGTVHVRIPTIEREEKNSSIVGHAESGHCAFICLNSLGTLLGNLFKTRYDYTIVLKGQLN